MTLGKELVRVSNMGIREAFAKGVSERAMLDKILFDFYTFGFEAFIFTVKVVKMKKLKEGNGLGL